MMTALRNTEKKIIASAIEEKGFRLADFKPQDGNLQYKLKYLESGLFYIWKMHPDIWDNFGHTYSRYTPQRTNVKSRDGQWFTMYDAMGTFDKWLSTEIKMFNTELQTPDPWADFKNEHPEINNVIPNIERKLFTLQEQTELEKRLLQMADQIEKTLALNGQQTKHLRTEIKYLIDESKSQSKFNWAGISIGVIFGIQSFLDIHPDQIIALWDIFNQALKSLPSLTGFNPTLLNGE